MSRNSLLLLSLFLILLGFFGWQNTIELRAEEPRRAIVSLEMFLSGEYVIPQINGWSYYNKPPVFNWIMTAFFWLFGSVSEWVVRLPSLLSLVVLAGLHFKFVRRFVSKEVAVLSALFFLTGAEILFYGSVNSGEIDPFYALVVYLQVMAIFIFYQQKNFWKLFLWSYFLVAVGFLTKGLPSLAFQALTLLAVAVYHRNWRLLFTIPHVAGVLLMLLLCSSYFYAYGLQEDVTGFLVRQFKEASQRTGLETAASDTLQQLFLFPLQVAKLLLPWSLLAVFFFRRFKTNLKANPLLSFAVIFIVANIPIYWISGDYKARYLFMFLPFFTLLLAYFYVENRLAMPKMRQVIKTVFGVMACALPLAMFSLAFIPQLKDIPALYWRLAIMALISAGAAFIYIKSEAKILAMVVVMAVARLGLNLFYLPAWQNDEGVASYRESIGEMLEITGDEQIFLYGKPHHFTSDASIGPLTFEEKELTTAPLLAYQIPYYISRANKKIMHFTPQLKEGKYHLAPAEMIDKEDQEVLFRLRDHWQHRDYVLIRP